MYLRKLNLIIFSKKKNKTKRQIRKSVGKQLRYLRRDIKDIFEQINYFGNIFGKQKNLN